MPLFSDERELLDFARKMLRERIDSLKNDVDRCLATRPDLGKPAPFPVLLYCFSTIDLLGAIYQGNATSRAHTVDQSKKYMIGFMRYPENEARLLQKLFRHKLVHLAQPAPVVEDGDKRVSWHLYHDYPRHRELEKLATSMTCPITTHVSFKFDYKFHISIADLVSEIEQSVQRSGGYLDSLKGSPELRMKFDTAIAQIYSIDADPERERPPDS